MNEGVEKMCRSFDWVTGRALCSLPNVFKELENSVKEGLDPATHCAPPTHHTSFSMTEQVNSLQFAGRQRSAQVNRPSAWPTMRLW